MRWLQTNARQANLPVTIRQLLARMHLHKIVGKSVNGAVIGNNLNRSTYLSDKIERVFRACARIGYKCNRTWEVVTRRVDGQGKTFFDSPILSPIYYGF